MASVELRVQEPGDWAYVVVNRPRSRNSIDATTLNELNTAVSTADPRLRMLVIRGEEGTGFLSGADIAAMRHMSLSEAQAFSRSGHEFCVMLEEHDAVIGALVDGYALGGGTEIALACDVVVSTKPATFGLPEVRLGIFPGWGGTQRLPRQCGWHKALPVLLSGRVFDGPTAQQMGMVSALVDDVAEGHLWYASLADDIRLCAPHARSAAKRSARLGSAVPLRDGLRVERELWLDQFDSDERTEGMDSFLAKSPPAWSSP